MVGPGHFIPSKKVSGHNFFINLFLLIFWVNNIKVGYSRNVGGGGTLAPTPPPYKKNIGQILFLIFLQILPPTP